LESSARWPKVRAKIGRLVYIGSNGIGMKQKKPVERKCVISEEILAEARRSVVPDVAKPPVSKCVVCGDEAAPNTTEALCWVCRRLKISAWRDGDQMPLQD